MVDDKHINGAYYVLHQLLIRARFMALNNESRQQLAILLDHVEYLPKLLAEPYDRTRELRDVLAQIESDVPTCSAIDDWFEHPPKNW